MSCHWLQDFTSVFAAGNEGVSWNANDGLKTVTSPATSKNCIAAGATNTAYQQEDSATTSQFIVYRMSISQVHQNTSYFFYGLSD